MRDSALFAESWQTLRCGRHKKRCFKGQLRGSKSTHLLCQTGGLQPTKFPSTPKKFKVITAGPQGFGVISDIDDTVKAREQRSVMRVLQKWVWVKIKAPGIGTQVLVLGSIC